MRKLVYFIACTADGFIARENGSFDFFPMTGDHLPFIAREYPETIPGHLRKDFGVCSENRHFSSVVMGRHTYEVGSALGITNPYPHLQQLVVSSTLAESPDANVQLVAHDPVAVVRSLKQQSGLGIWLCGGARLAGNLYDEIDEIVLKVNPIVLGAGIPLFRDAIGVTRLELTDHQTFTGGVAIHRYRVAR
jgi:dihydrofolate reductase